MCNYLDARLLRTNWVEEYTRGRVEPLPDCNFVMSTNHLWEPNLKKTLNEKMLDCAESE